MRSPVCPELVLLLSLSSCVVVHDFGEVAGAEATGTTEGSTGPGHDGHDGADDSGGDTLGATSGLPPDESSAEWEHLWGPADGTSIYTGLGTGPSGDVVAAGLTLDGSSGMRGLVHRYALDGTLLEEAIVEGMGKLQLFDGCELDSGSLRVVGGELTLGWTAGELAIWSIDGGSVGTSMPYEGSLAPLELASRATDIVCGSDGVWIAFSVRSWGSLARFDSGGLAGEHVLDGDLVDLAFSGALLDVLVTDEELDRTRWLRLQTDGTVVHEELLPGTAAEIVSRGDHIVTGGYDGSEHDISARTGAGDLLWTIDRLDGVPFFVQSMAIGPDDRLAVNAHLYGGADRLYVLDPDGAVEWSLDLVLPPTAPGTGDVLTVDMLMDDEGGVVLAGRGIWTAPDGQPRDQAWIARHLPPS